MKDAQNQFQTLLDDIFASQQNKPTIKVNGERNNVIGALAEPNNYATFKELFRKRIERLRDFYKDKNHDTIIKTLQDLAQSKTWAGAYAETVVYDIIAKSDYFSQNSLEFDKTMSNVVSYAQEMGNAETNEDIYFSEIDVYADIKCFQDVIKDILNGIKDSVKKNLNLDKNWHIQFEYPLDDEYEQYKENISKIKAELKNKLKSFTKDKYDRTFRSSIISHLSWKFIYGGGVLSSESCYDPYEQAESLKNMIFTRYTKKIMKNEPFLLILVNFPWYNSTNTNAFGTNREFYRSLARRTFIQYKNSNQLANTIIPKFSGTQTIYEVSQCISGILFIDDNIIEDDSYTSYLYLNPNAKKTILYRSHIEQLVNNGKDGEIDDFEHDNY